ncbi:MAG: RNB domain-containing ribonuclease [Novosphingobium sp.]
MKVLGDPDRLLAEGLAAIRAEFQVPAGFPPDVEQAAKLAAARAPSEHADRTGMPFVTLDPASSTDLDQAFAIETSGSDLLLHYAIADVAWFVADGDPVDAEAWRRGATSYLPDGKAGLYPAVLGEHAASLLPDGPRPAIVLRVRIAPDGGVKLDGAERALIRSRAKLAYETASEAELPAGFAELARRIAEAEARRGAARVDPPEQEVAADGDGHLTLRFRPFSLSETRNAALSLAANLAVADAMLAAGTGLFRVMAPPDGGAEQRLRATAGAFHLDWPAALPLADFQRGLDPANPRAAAFMLAIRRAGHGASYQAWSPGFKPWHAAMAASYAHATAPLRRLADRYVLRAVMAIANGQQVPAEVTDAFARLPRVMAAADARDSRIARAVIDMAEVALLAPLVNRRFPAVVTDIHDGDARIQLADLPVVARVKADGVLPGAPIRVKLLAADPLQRRLDFTRVN